LGAVEVEGRVPDCVGVAFQGMDECAGDGIPDGGIAVEACGDDLGAVGAESRVEYRFGMTSENV